MEGMKFVGGKDSEGKLHGAIAVLLSNGA